MEKKEWELNISEEEFDRQFEQAQVAWLEAASTEPRAQSVRYSRHSDLIIITLTNGVEMRIPRHLIQDLGKYSPGQIANLHISGTGDSIHWEKLDLDFGIPELVAGIFGTKTWMSELGKRGGKSSSPRKTAAARANGRKGGRPRKASLQATSKG